jgi:hypothetical protein
MKNFAAKTLPQMTKIAGALLSCFLLGALGLACTPVSTGVGAVGVASFEGASAEGRVRKVFSNWTPAETTDGICQTRHARLILHSDGSREWEVELLSREPGRRWEQEFHFYDGTTSDATWFGSRFGGAFLIPYANVWTFWRFGRGPGDRSLAAAFDKIRSVVWTGGC